MTTTATPVQTPPTPERETRKGQPTWEMAELYPAQGDWTERDYLKLNLENRRVEYIDGFVEFLPMPTMSHELIVRELFRLLDGFVLERNLGEVFFPGIRAKLEPKGSKQYRVPDIAYMSREHAEHMGDDFWQGTDLAIEVISPDEPKRDTEEKRRDYAAGGIPEYWSVNPLDPDNPTVTVLTLNGEQYDVHGVFGPGKTATSRLLDGFCVDVSQVFASGNQ